MPDEPPVYKPGVNWGDALGIVARPTGGSYGTPVAEGAGFKYDEATLHELVKEWLDLAKEFKDDLIDAELLAKAQPPGKEFASGGNADITRESGQALKETLDQRVAYCEKMADKYRTALGKYATAEDGATTAINQQPKGII
ncbi:hypothetical protein C791_6108 [Amycolatopsis azurea DSM 43854]|uniref:PE domain-containing protein n=1 Tax=Amycolatopsis azurea DSM 43854 TaxID=1238180 RepID=M2QAR7_9PSEU|nr:hypothetical protein C791_6108 [Amycolatopsis azurea DSM 43854]